MAFLFVKIRQEDARKHRKSAENTTKKRIFCKKHVDKYDKVSYNALVATGKARNKKTKKRKEPRQ